MVRVEDPVADGRRARRERNRIAVIDALFALAEEGRFPPPVEAVAARADVSVSSVFRYFDGLDDLHEQTIARYFERFAPLFELPDAAGDDQASRVRALVDARVDLYEAVAPIARMARHLAAEQPRIADELGRVRRRMTAQVRAHFAPDLAGLHRSDAGDRVALIDCLTAFEAWDLLTDTHGRSRRLVQRAWTSGVATVLARS